MTRSAALIVIAVSLVGLLSACNGAPEADLTCGSRPAQVLAAQSVPSAEYVPCITEIAEPWALVATDTDQDRTEIRLQWLASESANQEALVTLSANCDSSGASPITPAVPTDVEVATTTNNKTVSTYYEFPGGCVEASVTRTSGHPIEALTARDFAVQLVPREDLNDFVLEQTSDSVGLNPDEDE
jgi:hypothetical protein